MYRNSYTGDLIHSEVLLLYDPPAGIDFAPLASLRRIRKSPSMTRARKARVSAKLLRAEGADHSLHRLSSSGEARTHFLSAVQIGITSIGLLNGI